MRNTLPPSLVLIASLLWGMPLHAAERASTHTKPYYCVALPRADWLSAAELQTRLRDQGYTLVRMRLGDDKCYIVMVKDGNGQTRDLIVHPVTAEVVRDLKL